MKKFILLSLMLTMATAFGVQIESLDGAELRDAVSQDKGLVVSKDQGNSKNVLHVIHHRSDEDKQEGPLPVKLSDQKPVPVYLAKKTCSQWLTTKFHTYKIWLALNPANALTEAVVGVSSLFGKNNRITRHKNAIRLVSGLAVAGSLLYRVRGSYKKDSLFVTGCKMTGTSLKDWYRFVYPGAMVVLRCVFEKPSEGGKAFPFSQMESASSFLSKIKLWVTKKVTA